MCVTEGAVRSKLIEFVVGVNAILLRRSRREGTKGVSHVDD